MKKKNTNIEKTSNRDILKNKIIQLNEAVFVKKMDLKDLVESEAHLILEFLKRRGYFECLKFLK